MPRLETGRWLARGEEAPGGALSHEKALEGTHGYIDTDRGLTPLCFMLPTQPLPLENVGNLWRAVLSHWRGDTPPL